MPHRLYGYHTRGFMYVVACHSSGIVKIGFSLRPKERAKQVRPKVGPTARLVGIVRCSWGAEINLHKALRPWHIVSKGGEFYPLEILTRAEVPEKLRAMAASCPEVARNAVVKSRARS